MSSTTNETESKASESTVNEQPWLQYISLHNLEQRVYHKKVQAVNNLRRHLFDARVGVEQNVTDDGIDQCHSGLHSCIRATGGQF